MVVMIVTAAVRKETANALNVANGLVFGPLSEKHVALHVAAPTTKLWRSEKAAAGSTWGRQIGR
jgi:hypothetical protein